MQFTCSGFKNVMPAYLTLIDHSLAFAQELIRADLGGDRMGWLAGADAAFTFPPGKTENDVPMCCASASSSGRRTCPPMAGRPTVAARQ